MDRIAWIHDLRCSMLLTSVSSFLSRIEQDEVDAREETLKLFYAMRKIGERRLLTRSLNWQRFLYVKPDGLGESTEDPEKVRERESLSGNRKRWARQKESRRGYNALVDARNER